MPEVTNVTSPDELRVSDLVELLDSWGNQLNADLVLKLYTDGSGRVQDNATGEDRLTFDNVGELTAWLYGAADRPAASASNRQHARFLISNPCLGGFHSHCEGADCQCRCHQSSEGSGE